MLIESIDGLAGLSNSDFTIFAIDDASFEHSTSAPSWKLSAISSINVITLNTNLGHQRAIAVGLCEIARLNLNFDVVIIMDSDGEDSPSDIFKLINKFLDNRDSIVVAERTIRSESIFFKVMYSLYKFLFNNLTGRQINFGNFSLIPTKFISRIIGMPELWNHFAATLLRSGLPIHRVPTSRGRRYSGKSSMSFVALVTHGLGAISVFIDFFLVRTLIVLILISLLSLIAIFLIICLKFFTQMTIPGWATYTTALAFIVFLQSSMFSFFAIFMILSTRSIQSGSPSSFAADYVSSSSVKFTLNKR
jgi:glycosyltransferase involved in cell wall biosynthesis